MNAELPPFKNWEHNSENASTIDLVITPLIETSRIYPAQYECMVRPVSQH